jgi:hypothetical protein
MNIKALLVSLGAIVSYAALPAQAGLLTYQGVTFASSWKGNVLTLEIDAATHTGDWSRAQGLKALELDGIGNYSSVSVTAAPKAASGWTMSGDELTAKGCSGDTNGQAGSRLCFYGAQMALTNDMVFSFTFNGLNVKPADPHVKVEFVSAKGGKVGSLLSQTLPASPAAATPAPLPAAASTPTQTQASAPAPTPAASTTPAPAPTPTPTPVKAAASTEPAPAPSPAPAPAPVQTAASTTQTPAPTPAKAAASTEPAPAPAPAPAPIPTPAAPATPVQTVELPPSLTPPTGLPAALPAALPVALPVAASREPIVAAASIEPVRTPVSAAEPKPAAKPSADVPEPHGLALLMAGLGMMGITLRRRKKARTTS